ncbi:hypothetical protein BKA62DRAFT_691800 [Auriculariales sp. MPI-PUGE-AT-0066]|nr:hypothetical protein BKA62DRAFT_691800 [Auriculariales sp. MPI-PUGE-AT-0066]
MSVAAFDSDDAREERATLLAQLALGEATLRYGVFARIAGLSLLWYDYFLTFASERKRIWSRKKTWFIMFWCLVRYAPLLMKTTRVALAGFVKLRTLHACQRFFVFSWLSDTLPVMIAGYSFLLRLYALYKGSLRALIVPTLLWLSYPIIILMIVRDGATASGALLSSAGCQPQLSIDHMQAMISIAISFHSVVFIMVMFRCLQLWRRQGDKKLLSVLIRDDVGYFGMIAIISTLNLMALQNVPSPILINVLLMLNTTLPPVIVCRMTLCLRAAGKSPTPQSPSVSGSLSRVSSFNDLSRPTRGDLGSILDRSFATEGPDNRNRVLVREA